MSSIGLRERFEVGLAALAEHHDPAPTVTAATRAMRRARAEQLDEVHAVVADAKFYKLGYMSPAAWLATTSREADGACRVTLHLAERVQKMPVVKSAFAAGELAESALRLLADAWHPDVAGAFARDEAMLCHWAQTLGNRDFKVVLDTWRTHADPDREERTAQQRYDARSLHVSSMLDGMGRLDATLDPEGLAIVREALRSLSQPAADDARTPAQRRHDALVTLARYYVGTNPTGGPIAPEHVPGRKRRRHKVVATIDVQALVDRVGTGTLDTNSSRTVVSADTARRMACDCDIHRLITGPQSTILDFGRSQRVVSDPLFDVLAIRDGGCRIDGCDTPAGGCDAHHAIHWINHGDTAPDNLALVCWHHHHWLHEQHWRLQPHGGGHFTLIDPNGAQHAVRPPWLGHAIPTLFEPLI